MTNPAPTPAERVEALLRRSGAPNRVLRCHTHHACECGEWMAQQWREQAAALASQPAADTLDVIRAANYVVDVWADKTPDGTHYAIDEAMDDAVDRLYKALAAYRDAKGTP